MKYSRRVVVAVICCLVAGASTLSVPRCTDAGGSIKKLRIIYSNDTYGYLEPCGCGGRYEGGLSRRSTLISQLVKESPNSVIVETGNVSHTKGNVGIVVELLSKMKYDAVGVGDQDLQFASELFKQTAHFKLPVVDAQRKPEDSVAPYVIKQVDGVKVGIVSCGADVDTSVKSRKILYETLKDVRGKSDILILLDEGGIGTEDWLRRVAPRVGVPDIVIGGIANSAIDPNLQVGKTRIVKTSVQGRQIGVIDIDVAPDHTFKTDARLVLVNKTIAEDASVAKRINDFVLRPVQPEDEAVQAIKSDGKYYSPESCQKCHSEEYEDWIKSKHACAVSTLRAKNRLIPECLPCHSEEYRRTSVLTKKPANIVAGVECATCHASVLPHGEDGPAENVSAKIDQSLCTTCHNPERSPNYNVKTYLPKVSHIKVASAK